MKEVNFTYTDNRPGKLIIGDAQKCDIKLYNGYPYITLDGKNVEYHHNNTLCSHCQKKMLFHLVYAFKDGKKNGVTLYSDCPKGQVGYGEPAIFMQKQTKLDRWLA